MANDPCQMHLYRLMNNLFLFIFLALINNKNCSRMKNFLIYGIHVCAYLYMYGTCVSTNLTHTHTYMYMYTAATCPMRYFSTILKLLPSIAESVLPLSWHRPHRPHPLHLSLDPYLVSHVTISCDCINWLHIALSLSLARSKKQEFIEKLRELQRKLEQGGYGDPDEAQNASFGRETLLADAYQFIMGSSARDLRRRRLNARWDREEGWGERREWIKENKGTWISLNCFCMTCI